MFTTMNQRNTMPTVYTVVQDVYAAKKDIANS